MTIDFSEEKAWAVCQCLKEGKDVSLRDLLRDPRDRNKQLDLIVFIIRSNGRTVMLPEPGYNIKKDDQLLFCGTELAYRLFNATLNNEYKLFYVQSGWYKPRSYLMQWYVKKTNRIGV